MTETQAESLFSIPPGHSFECLFLPQYHVTLFITAF